MERGRGLLSMSTGFGQRGYRRMRIPTGVQGVLRENRSEGMKEKEERIDRGLDGMHGHFDTDSLMHFGDPKQLLWSIKR
ncbi:hypothetical protein GOBAR_AA18339 [Gossypium barbadense]|uniref:Uncharacterized protein n=1 Tax=Gossypium barbadense TaxID=3634 RepID=A0A2P5XG66_GOSBA|nr:hypothetical protein GOBAR_AA18339 [Gossypium barbadense]